MAMTAKWNSSFEDLKTFLKEKGEVGNWKTGGNGEEILSLSNGIKLVYYPTTNTISIRGKKNSQLQEKYENMFTSPNVTSGQGQSDRSIDQTRIFIVHGHDSVALEQLELILLKLDLKPYILKNEAAQSETLIEALEQKIYETSVFGIILMTPDDWGYGKDQDDSDKKPRARQNVILEMGMVLASLGRKNCAVLKKQNLELPSDVEGIIRYEFNEHVKEVAPKLVKHLSESGFEFDDANVASVLDG